MRLIFTLVLTFTAQLLTAQNIPAWGTDSTLDIACWNIEWFGHPSNGPSNNLTQLKNAVSVIKKSDADVWGLCEISTAAYWDSLKKNLPDYDGVISEWNQEQKTALIYKKSQFRFLYQRHILAVYDYDFASGRLPLEVALETTMNGKKDTLYFLVIHLKANTGSSSEKQTSYNRRKTSSEAMKDFMLQTKWKKFVVLGDWNDDVDKSIYNNLATPFSATVSDTTNFLFTTATLSAAGKSSTASYSEMIDHHLISARMKPFYHRNSSAAVNMGLYITQYSNTTSDHYPVFSRFRFNAQSQQQQTNGISRIRPEITDNGEYIQCAASGTATSRLYHINGSLLKSEIGNKIKPGDFTGMLIAEFEMSDGRTFRTLIMR